MIRKTSESRVDRGRDTALLPVKNAKIQLSSESVFGHLGEMKNGENSGHGSSSFCTTSLTWLQGRFDRSLRPRHTNRYSLTSDSLRRHGVAARSGDVRAGPETRRRPVRGGTL